MSALAAVALAVVCAVSGVGVGWCLGPRAAWCRHCGYPLVCTACGRKAPAARTDDPPRGGGPPAPG